jgi:hypothetical protein
MTPYQKNRLIVSKDRIKKLENEISLLKKQPLKVLAFGILSSLFAQNFTGSGVAQTVKTAIKVFQSWDMYCK